MSRPCDKKEADIIGAALAHRAGYDSAGLIRFFELSERLKATNPLYISHPPDQESVRTISLIRNKELYRLDDYWLTQQDPAISYVYQTLSARSPKD